MIQVPPNAAIVVMHEPINFRTGIDGVAAIARLVLERDPMDGALFVCICLAASHCVGPFFAPDAECSFHEARSRASRTA